VLPTLFALACSSTNAISDAGDASADATDGADGEVGPGSCYGTEACWLNAAYTCRDGMVTDLVASCDPLSCSLGRCVSAACATEESDRTSFAGCLFYAFEPDNVTSDAGLATSFLVTNSRGTAAFVSIETLVPVPGTTDTAWGPLESQSIAPLSSGRFRLMDYQVSNPGTFIGAAIRVRSDQPVTVAVVHSDDTNQSATFSSGGTMVWPIQSLGSHYRVMTYSQVATPEVDATAGGLGGAGRLVIVGTQPGTDVMFIPSSKAMIAAIDSIQLQDGDVYQLYSTSPDADLSGTEIYATRPVAVFSGNITTSYGRAAPGVNSPDMAHEQLPPVGAWSRRYVAAALPPQEKTCDSLFGETGASLWRILAAQDNTMVSFDPPDLAGLPPSPITLAAGEPRELVVVGSFTVTATLPVLVTQGMDCEPSLSLAVSTDKFLPDLSFAVLPGFDQLVSVVRVAGSGAITLDGAMIAGGSFQAAGGGYEVAQVPLPTCPPSLGVCTHRLTGIGGFGMTLRGMDVLASYALTAPTFKGCIDPSDPACPLD
jgi:hypothetical protein